MVEPLRRIRFDITEEIGLYERGADELELIYFDLQDPEWPLHIRRADLLAISELLDLPDSARIQLVTALRELAA